MVTLLAFCADAGGVAGTLGCFNLNVLHTVGDIVDLVKRLEGIFVNSASRVGRFLQSNKGVRNVLEQEIDS